jgi:hypothetical protein
MNTTTPVARYLVHDTEKGTGITTAVRRLSDGRIFTVGDHIILSEIYHGKNVNGKITHFSYDGNGGYHVYTTWSKVGFSLDYAVKTELFSVGDIITCCLLMPNNRKAHIRGVHVYSEKNKYDIELFNPVTRMYNIDADYIEAFVEKQS